MSLIQLVKILADGQIHSGEELGKLMSISRAAIWKQLKQLDSYDLTLESVKGVGYKLAEPITLLNQNEIQKQLSVAANARINNLEIVDSIDSTNSALMLAAKSGVPSGSVMVAEQQKAGRGRRGRVWKSPFARNLYVSMLWQFHGGIAALEGLSLVVGVVLIKALESVGVSGVELKWPNDLLFQGKKLGGILVEMTGDLSGTCNAVIGFGINVNMPKILGSEIDQPWTDLSSICGHTADRNQILAAILNHLVDGLQLFEQNGFSAFKNDWAKYDCLSGKEVIAMQGDGVIVGIANGVSASGGLKIQTDQGEQHVTGGEVSVRVQL